MEYLKIYARALTFTALIIANLGLILTNHSWSETILVTVRQPNKAVWIIIGGALVLLGGVIYLPFFRHLFHFSILHPIDLAICLGAGLTGIIWFEILKIVRRNSEKNIQWGSFNYHFSLVTSRRE